MNLRMRLLALVLLLTTGVQLKGQEIDPPKREFRGVWIATVANIDWPTKGVWDVNKQKKDLLTILDEHKRQGLNAVVFQIRPAADALYANSGEPWSQWLTGIQGKAPNEIFDPLAFAIEESHKRGMELHAWFNPYRATFDGTSPIHQSHITKQKPEWFFAYGGKKLFDPGIPAVREYITQVILNVVKNYDIDGVHFDDYFYPYAIKGQVINDALSFKNYNDHNIASLADWRRDNVDRLMKMVSDSIKHYKSYVKFGISPFGIWQNRRQNVEGSETNGGDSYHGLFADSRKWVKEGWVDYINPQIYWSFESGPAPYAKLVDWWSNNAYGRHLYIGHGAYRINDLKDLAWRNPNQIPNQIVYNRQNPRVQGSIYFSSKSLTSNRLGVADSLSTNYYKSPALPPVMLWIDSVAPNNPQNLLALNTGKSVVLSWKQPLPARDKEPAYGYVIYRFENGETINTEKASSIKNIYFSDITSWEDKDIKPGNSYTYVVTALDRMKNESEYAIPATIIIEEQPSIGKL